MADNKLMDFLASSAPTIASALLGPMAGVAVAGLGKIFGIDNATTTDITKALADGKLTPEQMAAIKTLELQLQADEKERGFRYAELEFKDRDSARKANVDGGTQKLLFWLSILLLSVALGSEVRVLFWGYPKEIVDALLVGRILGLFDAVSAQVLAYWYGTSQGAARTKELLAQAPAIK